MIHVKHPTSSVSPLTDPTYYTGESRFAEKLDEAMFADEVEEEDEEVSSLMSCENEPLRVR